MELAFATTNPHKVREIQSMVSDIDILDLNALHWNTPIEETEHTLHGNAILKAKTIADTLEIACFAEDTGLEVDALDGAPGVYSARYAGDDANAEKNMAKLMSEMQGVSDRSARFRTVIALIIDDAVHIFEGKVEGTIAETPSGSQGFGYDPLFTPIGHTRTFAEMTDEEKNNISHRGRATEKFIAFLRGYLRCKNP